MNKPITMRELQKMSAATLQALPYAVPVKSGRRTVAMIVPVRQPDDIAPQIEKARASAEAADAARAPDVRARIDAYLAAEGWD